MAPLAFSHSYAEEKVDVFTCINDQTYLGLIANINDKIDDLTAAKRDDIKKFESILRFNRESESLSSFLGSNKQKMDQSLLALAKNEKNDFTFVMDFYRQFDSDKTTDFADLNESAQKERFKMDMQVIAITVLNDVARSNAQTPEEIRTLIDSKISSFTERYGKVKGFYIDELVVEEARHKINLALANNSKKEIAGELPEKLNSQLSDYVANTTQSKYSCHLITDESPKHEAKWCADKIEKQFKLFNTVKGPMANLLKINKEAPEYATLDSYEYNRSVLNKSKFDRRVVSSDQEKIKNDLIHVVGGYNNLFKNQQVNELSPMPGPHSYLSRLNSAYRDMSTKLNLTNIPPEAIDQNAFTDYLSRAECQQPDLATEYELQECVQRIQQMNRYSGEKYPLISLREKFDPMSLSEEGKQKILNLVNATDFPSNKIVHYLNLMNYAKNRYMNNNSNDPKCQKGTEGRCVNILENQIAYRQRGLKSILQLGDKLKSNYISDNTKSDIDAAAIKLSCEELNPDGNLKILCNEARVANADNQSSAYARYKRGEIPVFQEGTWKWKKKTSNLEHFATGAVHGTQQVLPTWLNLIQTKGAINYETERAIYMKQYNYLQNQYMQNWLQNYYANPQTFSNGYYNIYNPTGFSYGTGFGF